MEKIFIQCHKLMENLPRFDNDRNHRIRGYKKDTNKSLMDHGRTWRFGMRLKKCRVYPRKSYANIVAQTKPWRHRERHMEQYPSFNISFIIYSEDLTRLRRAYVENVKSKGDTYLAQQKLHLEGIFSIRAKPMGSSLVLPRNWRSKGCWRVY